jgi:hypothetical protein
MRGLTSLKWIIPAIGVIQIFRMNLVSLGRGAGIAEIRTKGWDDWNGLIHTDNASSSSDRMHQDTPIDS